MRRFARLTMLVVGFLALQVSVLGGGVACLLAASAGHAVAVSPGMAEMGMAPATSDNGQTDAGRLAIGSSKAPVQDQSPCQQSSAQHSSCQSMTACAAAFAITPINGVTANDVAPSGRIALVEVALSSRSLSPDLPPPKA